MYRHSSNDQTFKYAFDSIQKNMKRRVLKVNIKHIIIITTLLNMFPIFSFLKTLQNMKLFYPMKNMLVWNSKNKYPV